MGIRKLFKALGRSQSGNAAMLVALGMPVLVGGTGYAVDTAQWYLWKRELQHAVDQAAIAGAWAKAEDPTGDSYLNRADREYEANIDLVDTMDTGATVTLEDYDGGTDNSVQVTASATGTLAFSSYITGTATTVTATAVAIHEPAESWTPCLLALDDSSSKAVWFSGGPTVTAECGVGSLSDASDSIVFDGNSGSYDLDYIISKGGVSAGHGQTDGDTVIEDMGDIADPYDGLTPPDDSNPRTLSCPTSGGWTSDQKTVVSYSYAYYTKKKGKYVAYSGYSNPRSAVTADPVWDYGYSSANQPTDTSTTQDGKPKEVPGQGNDDIYEIETTTTTITYHNKVNNAASSATMQPGTYTDFTISCPTTLNPGVYVIDGGDFKISSTNASITGTGVMFVLKNGAGIDITGGSISLTAMLTVEELIAVGVSAEDAEKMIGMLFFEDSNSSTTGNKITGNTNTVMNGVVYTPNSGISISGTMRGSSECLQLAAATLKITGTADLTTLCPVNATPIANIATRTSQVRLVR